MLVNHAMIAQNRTAVGPGKTRNLRHAIDLLGQGEDFLLQRRAFMVPVHAVPCVQFDGGTAGHHLILLVVR